MNRKERFRKLVNLGCAACRRIYDVYSEPEIHHIKVEGMGRKASDDETIGLCPIHHRLSHTESVHLAPKHFYATFGTELELLEYTNSLLNE